MKRQPAAPSHADVRSHLSGSSAVQALPAREEIGTIAFFLSTYFQYDGSIYEQKDGAAMGSPVSAVIANLYMKELLLPF